MFTVAATPQAEVEVRTEPRCSGPARETQGDLVSKTRNRKLMHMGGGGNKNPIFSFTLATVVPHARQAPFSLSVFVRVDSSELFLERSRDNRGGDTKGHAG